MSILLLSENSFSWNTPRIGGLGNTFTKWTWTGATSTDWQDGSNWCGAYQQVSAGDTSIKCKGSSTAPVSGETLVFDDSCLSYGSRCSPTNIPANVTVNSIWMKSTYTGTINFGASNLTISGEYRQDGGTFTKTSGTITHNGTQWIQTAGTFNGGSGSITQSTANLTTTLAGTVTAPSGTWTLRGTTANMSGVTSFTHNSGQMTFINSNSMVLTPCTCTFFNVRVFNAGNANRTLTLAQDLTVTGDFDILVFASANTVNVSGAKVIMTNGNVTKNQGTTNGSSIFRFTGAGVQTITNTSTGGNPTFNAIEVAQAVSGSLKFNSLIWMQGLDTSASLGGPLDLNSLTHGISSGTYNVPGFTFPNLNVVNPSGSFTAFTSLTVTDLNLASTTTGFGSPTGQITVLGNVTASASSNGMSGQALISMEGTGSQSINLTGATNQYFPGLKINKGSGTLTISGTPTIGGNFTYLTGTTSIPSLIRFGNPVSGGNGYITSNGFTFNNIEFVGYNGYILNDTWKVGGNIVISNLTNTNTLGNTGAEVIELTGDLSATTSGISGFGVIKLVGVNQSVDMTGAPSSTARIPSIEIASSGNVTLLGTINVRGGLFRYTSGTVSALSSTVRFSTTGVSFSIWSAGMEFGNVIIETQAGNMMFQNTAVVRGTFTNASTSSNSSGGNIDLYGDLIWGGTGNGGTGIAITMKGNDSNLSKNGSNAFPQNLTIAKTAGQKVTMISNVTFPTNVDVLVTSGTLDMNGYALTIQGASGLLTISGGANVKLSSGNLTVNGVANIPAGTYPAGPPSIPNASGLVSL